jgi:hypothetical protein
VTESCRCSQRFRAPLPAYQANRGVELVIDIVRQKRPNLLKTMLMQPWNCLAGIATTKIF